MIFFLQFEEGPLHQKSFDHRSVSVILESLSLKFPALGVEIGLKLKKAFKCVL